MDGGGKLNERRARGCYWLAGVYSLSPYFTSSIIVYTIILGEWREVFWEIKRTPGRWWSGAVALLPCSIA